MTDPRRSTAATAAAIAAASIWTVAAIAPAPALAQAFTLEQVLSDPFPTDLTASADGRAVVWVRDDRGMRNVWVASAPEWKPRRVTAYDRDDGQELTEPALTPGGDAVVYVRGGNANRAGEIPNPTSDPEWPEQAVWVVRLDGGAPKKLGEGRELAVSPGGDVVALVRRGQIWTAPLDGSAAAKQLLTIRGSAGDLAWSPDGARLAFASRRGDHGFVGVYDLAAKRVRYMAPSTDHDRAPVWSPDGRRVAFVRVPNEKAPLPFIARRTALPWSIVVADPASGEGHAIWKADEGPGSAFASNDEGGRIFWTADGRIAFPWEKTGWLHLWSVPAVGGAAVDLTPGDFEIQHVALTSDQRGFLFSSNQGDIDRRHLWRVSSAGDAAPRALTSGEGLEWSPVAADDDVVFLASGPRTPAHAEVLAGGGRRAISGPPADFPSADLVAPRPVVFSASDGVRIHAQLFLPKGIKPGEKRPAVVFFHGGSRRQMLLGFHYMYYYHNAYAMNQYLASRGYIVLAVNYRSGIGYGLDFREALDYGARGASEYRDVQGAGLYLRSRDDVDPDGIGLWGGSYGGYLTALGLARASDLFAAGVDLHGVHDWNVVIRNFASGYDAAARADVAKLAFESSPLAAVDRWRSPVLLIQGDDDRNVPFSETVDLAEALRRRGVHFEELVFPDEVHDFLLERSWLAAYHAAADFFDRMLRQGGAEKLRADGSR